MNSLEKFKTWRENQSVKSEIEKHNLAFKIATIFTSLVIIFVAINWYFDIFGVLPENIYLTKLGEFFSKL